MSDMRFLTTGVHEGTDRIGVYAKHIYRAEFLGDKVLITFKNGKKLELNGKYERQMRYPLENFMPVPGGMVNPDTIIFFEFQLNEELGGSYAQNQVRLHTMMDDVITLTGTYAKDALNRLCL